MYSRKLYNMVFEREVSDDVMTSTLANEGAQHFYRKLGYRDSGCLILEDEPLEILLTKKLK